MRCLLLISLLSLLAFPGAAAATPNVVGQVEEFPLGAGTRPEAMVAGPDGNLWFAGVGYLAGGFADVVGKVTQGGKVTEFQVGVHSGNLGLSDIAMGPDGNLWFTEGGRPRVGRITPTGQITEFDLPAADASTASIVAGPDGNLWFTEWRGGKIGRITTSGQVTEFPLLGGRDSSGIAIGPDGALWITEPSAGLIARVGPEGAETDFPLPEPAGYPGEIIAGPDGALWFGKQRGGVLGRITTAGEMTQLPVRSGRQTFALSSGPFDDVWYSNGGGRIGWVIPGVLTGPPACISSCRAPITALTEGPDGKLWFAAGVGPGSPFSAGGTVGTYAPPPLEIRIREKGVVQGKTLLVPVRCRWTKAGSRCGGTLQLSGQVGGSKSHLLAKQRLRLRLGAERKFALRLPAAALRQLAKRGHLAVRVATSAGHGPRDVRRIVLRKS
jgi:streptogramin lyase